MLRARLAVKFQCGVGNRSRSRAPSGVNSVEACCMRLALVAVGVAVARAHGRVFIGARGRTRLAEAALVRASAIVRLAPIAEFGLGAGGSGESAADVSGMSA